jgi:uncharacterized protein (UPF0332 family)
LHLDLLAQARHLATLDPGRPRQVNLRRAVSSTYYAVFHTLVDDASRLLIGTRHGEAPFRHVIGRAFSHQAMKQACASFARGTLRASVAKGLPVGFTVAVPIRELARTFVELQEQRHLADYDRTENFRRSEVLMLIQQAETAVAAFSASPRSVEENFFLVCLLTWPTLAGR